MQHEADAASWRDTSVNYWREFSGRPNPVDGGPLSLAVTAGGKERRGFDLSASSYTVPAAITAVRALDPAARAELVSQTDTQAVVKVTKTDFFGPLVKNYVFNIVPDTSLASLRVNRRPLTLQPGVTSYTALIEPGTFPAPVIDAVASDPAATVSVEPGRVTVTNGSASTVYTVNVNRVIRRGPWSVVRPDDARRRVRDDGSVVITSQAGDLQGTANTAKNLTLQDVNGDWTMESKVVFSRALAANNEQGGIVAYADDQNYVKLAWEMSSVTQAINKLRVVFLREQGGTAQTFQVTGADAQKLVGASGAIWLRIAKTGGTYKAYYSSDGAVWRYFATATLNVEPARAGLLAFNRGGTSTDLDVAFESFAVQSAGEVVPSLIAEAPGTVGGTVPATLSLSLGAAATFAPFVPGVAREYTAATTATVISTAGDAALTVSDPGRLVNGAFSLPQPLSVAFSKAAWSAPVSNEVVDVTFKQAIGATDALRTGTYSKTLTFTLSTTSP